MRRACRSHTYTLRIMSEPSVVALFFFFNDTATTEIYTLSLHDALPIYLSVCWTFPGRGTPSQPPGCCEDRKSTRLNSSHSQISYAVFCLKKKTQITPFNFEGSGFGEFYLWLPLVAAMRISSLQSLSLVV